jgi:RES domain
VSLRLPETGTFEDLLRPVRVEVSSLVRLSRYPATEPYWSSGVYRFDDPDPGRAGEFGACYTAGSIEVAFAESVIHESGRFVDGAYEVPSAELTERSVVRFACDRRKTLVLADLTGAALKALGLNNDISALADYSVTQAWAQAIHDADPRWQGIRYVSRQMNKGFAYAIFERSGLKKLRSEKLKVAQLDALCDLFNVAAV